ncbi:MAG TPA: hypothetical protein VFB99_24375 [Vicinamibacterales bacterium]|nr:hypothetical protein [Vicinamibacterales bacterium]
MQAPAEPAHIRRAENALVCRNCGKTKEIRKKTTADNVAAWVREHERCSQRRK